MSITRGQYNERQTCAVTQTTEARRAGAQDPAASTTYYRADHAGGASMAD
ncbi:hypothetical protein M3I54_20020 [Paraburkholderia sp. CNPSo 3274]|nr:hypothetical protein [Paraburkholderia sp. CNPSo 3274]MCP3709252.1 hypothetical protein [Paraburkholderia sp. CNPSo 3274]